MVFFRRLSPNRSLSKKAATIVVGALAILASIISAVFIAFGAWPVLGFMFLDVVLLYFALKVNVDRGSCSQEIEITPNSLRIAYYKGHDCLETFCFNPYWVAVEFQFPTRRYSKLGVRSHGLIKEIGEFLTYNQKAKLAEEIKQYLSTVQGKQESLGS